MRELARSQDEESTARFASLTESSQRDKMIRDEEQHRRRAIEAKLVEEQEQKRELMGQLEQLRAQLAQSGASSSSYAPARTKTRARTSGRATSSSAGPVSIEDVAPEPTGKSGAGKRTRNHSRRKKKDLIGSSAPQTNSNILPYQDINNDPYFIKL